MDVGDDDVIDCFASNAFGIQLGKQERNRIIGADIDEDRPPCLNDQMAGIEPGPMKAGIDRGDAVFKIHGCVAVWACWLLMIAERAAKGNAGTSV